MLALFLTPISSEVFKLCQLRTSCLFVRSKEFASQITTHVTHTITYEGTAPNLTSVSNFAAPFSLSFALVRVSSEDSREGQMGNSRPRVQITDSHHRWCSAAAQPWAFYGMRDSICHVDGSTNDMERDSR